MWNDLTLIFALIMARFYLPYGILMFGERLNHWCDSVYSSGKIFGACFG